VKATARRQNTILALQEVQVLDSTFLFQVMFACHRPSLGMYSFTGLKSLAPWQPMAMAMPAQLGQPMDGYASILKSIAM